MPKITFIETSGNEQTVEVASGSTLMEGAVANAITGILADCGGVCACATCHIYIEPDWLSKMPRAEDLENDMVEFADGARENSRLACQIVVTDVLDGLRVSLPERQGG